MDTFRKLFGYGREKIVFIFLAIILSAIATVLSFVPYYYFWKLLNVITSSADIYEIKNISYIIFFTTIAYAVAYLLSLVCSHIFAFRIESNMKKKGLNNLLEASFSFFDINQSGQIRKIIDDNSSNTHTIIAHIIPDFVNAVIFPVCLLIVAFLVDFRIGIIILVAIFLAMICFKFMYSDPNMMRDYMEALEDINAETVEYVRGIQVIKIFDTVIESFENLYKSIKHYSDVVNRQCQSCRIPMVAFQMIMMCLSATIIFVAISNFNFSNDKGKVITLAVFFASFVGLLFQAFMKIMFASKNFELAKDAVDKMEAVLASMGENKLTHGGVEEFKGYDIEFKNVLFEYDKDLPVLKDFTLRLDGDKKYALVGTSGGGKSTIAKLISGFYPVSKGEIRIGGNNIETYTSRALERNIAFVFQNSKLFNRSIYENVKIGNPSKSYDEVMRALELAMCNSILDKFEERENTVIGTTGVHLSGGEIQRIAIARAILKDAPIIILDEASAASDPENEYEVQQAFSKLMQGKTVIMIAHRLSSIRDVDEVLVIEGGKVVERGSHEKLMGLNGKYKKFQELYSKANEWRIQ